MTTAKAPVRAADMIDMLRRHYIPKPEQPAVIFAAEIAAPASARRADLIVQGVTAASGNALIGHEVKVSRDDVLAELDDLTKSDPWQRYCNRWWLVIPDATLIEGLDLPDTWGVLTPPSGRRTRSMTVHRPAPKLTPAEQSPALRTLATWLHWQRHRAAVSRDQHRESAQRYYEQAEEARRLAGPRESPHQAREHEVVTEIVRKLGGVRWDAQDDDRRIGSYQGSVSVDDVVAALKSLAEVRRRADRVEMWATSVGRLAERVKGEIRRVEKSVSEVAEATKAMPSASDEAVAS